MTRRHEILAEGRFARRTPIRDDYLEGAIEDGRPIEALIATRRLAEVAGARAKEAARVATEGPWAWTDVSRALGVKKQAAHEKLRARVQGKIDKKLSKLEQAEQAGHAKIARRAKRGPDKLEQHPQCARRGKRHVSDSPSGSDASTRSSVGPEEGARGARPGRAESAGQAGQVARSRA